MSRKSNNLGTSGLVQKHLKKGANHEPRPSSDVKRNPLSKNENLGGFMTDEDEKSYEERVQALEEEGLSRSDAQGVVDAEILNGK